MPGFARIEKCHTQDIAVRRRDALAASGFNAIIVQTLAFQVLSDVDVGPANQIVVNDHATPVDAPWMVIAIASG